LTDAEAALLKENMALKKKLKAKEDSDATAEENRLKEQGNFKSLAEKAEAKAKAAQDKLKLAVVKAKATKLGIIDEDLVSLIDLKTVTISEDGEVTGATEAIEALKASKPNFFITPSDSKQTTTPKPNGSQTATGAPASFADWEKMPEVDRYAWAEKNPAAYQALCEGAKRTPVRTF